MRSQGKRNKKNVFSYIVLCLYVAFILLPLFWLILTSLKDRTESYSIEWPSRVSLDNFSSVLWEYNIIKYFYNSGIIAGFTTIIILILSILATYGFTKFKYRHSDGVLNFCLLLRMIPFVTIIIPLYIVMAKLGLINTRLALILGNVSFNLPVAIWLLIPFFKDFPNELLEAAFIDGSSKLRTLISIVLPLSKPAIMVITIFMFISAWNEFMYALIMTTTQEYQPLTVAIANLTGKYGVRFDLMTAAAVLYVVPVITITIVFQKHIIGGLTAGAVKG